jgi:predicted RNase H-like nuclease
VTAVLGIDAAWTVTEPSGVSLLSETVSGWRSVALAPSYQQFIDLARDIPVDWAARPTGGSPVVADLLSAARTLLGGMPVDVIAIDMPLATIPIVGRRAADSRISETFGGRGCGTHSPSAARPGPLGVSLLSQSVASGYPLGTTTTAAGTAPAIIEVYPHPALLTLLRARYRVRYKLARSRRYWPLLAAPARRRRVVRTWRAIDRVLSGAVGPTGLPLPPITTAGTISNARLKRFEDSLDALICGWVAIQYIRGHCTPFGDPTAAIWTP